MLREIDGEWRHGQALADLPTVRIYEDETMGVLDGQERTPGVECKIAGTPEKDKDLPCGLDVLTGRHKIYAASTWSNGGVGRGLRMGYDSAAPKGDDAAHQACCKGSLHDVTTSRPVHATLQFLGPFNGYRLTGQLQANSLTRRKLPIMLDERRIEEIRTLHRQAATWSECARWVEEFGRSRRGRGTCSPAQFGQCPLPPAKQCAQK